MIDEGFIIWVRYSIFEFGIFNLRFSVNLQYVMLLLIYANFLVFTNEKKKFRRSNIGVVPLSFPIRKRLNFSELPLSSSTSSLCVYALLSISAGMSVTYSFIFLITSVFVLAVVFYLFHFSCHLFLWSLPSSFSYLCCVARFGSICTI